MLSGTCGLVICLLLGMTWHVRPDRLGVTHTSLWFIANITHRMLSALFAIAIGILLSLVMRLGTSVRRRGLEQSWIRIELGIVMVLIVGFKVRVEWLSIVVVIHHQFQLLVSVTASNLSQLG